MRDINLRLLNTCLNGHRGDDVTKLADKLLGDLVETLMQVSRTVETHKRQQADMLHTSLAWQKECHTLSCKLARKVRGSVTGITIDETGRTLPKQPVQQQSDGDRPQGIS